MKISVVVATYNRSKKLQDCLTAIARQSYAPHEIIVVDDASTDNTEHLVQTRFPDVNYVRQATNRGPAAARNQGIWHARGEIVAFTDDDCVPPPDWLRQIVDAFQRQPDVVGVGGYQDPPPAFIASNRIARADHVRRLRRWGHQAHRQQRGGYEIPGLATNNVAYRRDLLAKVGGFDESFPVAAGEDADLKLRMAQHGPLLYLPLGVLHYRRYTLRAQWQLALRRGAGAYHFESKHAHPPTHLRIVLRLLKRKVNFIRDLFTTRPDVAAVIFITAVGDAIGQWQALLRADKSNSLPGIERQSSGQPDRSLLNDYE